MIAASLSHLLPPLLGDSEALWVFRRRIKGTVKERFEFYLYFGG